MSAFPNNLLQYRGPDTAKQKHSFPEWDDWYDVRKVRFLREVAERYGAEPEMREFVIRILQEKGVRERDYPAMCSALLSWVQENIYYVEEHGEQLYSPWRTIQMRAGDCDDAALLLAAMATSINLRCRFVLSGKVGKQRYRWVEGTPWPRQKPSFTHIYCEFQWPAGKPQWAASAEPTMKGAPLGYDFVLHGAKMNENGTPSLTPGIRQRVLENGFRRIGDGNVNHSQSFGSLGDTMDAVHEYLSPTTIVRRLTSQGFMGRIFEEIAIVIPVTLAAVITTYYAEKYLRSLDKRSSK